MTTLPEPYSPRSSGSHSNQNARPKFSKRAIGREPRMCLIKLFNTERVPAEDTAHLLRDVFGKNAKEAWSSGYFDRHIIVGPFTREVAETKMQQVRETAFNQRLVAPVMRRRFV